jgi:hypothetical protein
MLLLLLSLIVSAAVVIWLLRGRPNLFVFQLIERVFGGKNVRKD